MSSTGYELRVDFWVEALPGQGDGSSAVAQAEGSSEDDDDDDDGETRTTVSISGSHRVVLLAWCCLTMDQQAFRDLVAKQSAQAAEASKSASTAPRVFGAKQKKRQAGPSSSSSSSRSLEAELAPRNQKSTTGQDGDAGRPRRPFKNSVTGDVYVDRASLRRTGQTDEEYADLVALHDEWRNKWLAAETDDERRDIEEQMAFLGGDARHSVLVKGLDFALLAQEKAKAEGTEPPLPSTASRPANADDALEEAYSAATTSSASTSKSLIAESEQAPSFGQAKRSREEILEALKRRKLQRGTARSASPTQEAQSPTYGQVKADRDAEFEKARQSGKFKPIGFSEPASAADHRKGDVIITKDGKRLRKKIKKSLPPQPVPGISDGGTTASGSRLERGEQSSASQIPATVPQRQTDTNIEPTFDANGSRPPPGKVASSSSGPSADSTLCIAAQDGPVQDVEEASENVEQQQSTAGLRSDTPSHPADEQPPITRPAAPASDSDEDEDEDEDIFEGAGPWTGLASDDDEPAEEKPGALTAQRRAPRPQSTNPVGQDWFGNISSAQAPDAGLELGGSIAPGGQIGQILSSVGVRMTDSSGPPHGQESAQQQQQPQTSLSQGHTPQTEREATGGRLQGLSDSALPSDYSRRLLEEEKAREAKAEENRKNALRERIKKKKEKRQQQAAAAEASDAD